MNLNKARAAELSYISKRSGQTEELVQAGGGNTSVKLDGELMLIKSSGFQLTEVTADSGYSTVNYRLIARELADVPDDAAEQDILSRSLVSGGKPSIETFLHSVTKKYTIHTHPLGVNILTALSDGMEELKRLFPKAAFVGYATPGIKLAKLYYAETGQSCPDIVFLKNHGLIVSADSPEEALAIQDKTVLKVNEYLKRDSGAYVRGNKLFEALNRLEKGLIAYRISSPAAEAALKQTQSAQDLRFSPDCVVYMGKSFFTVSDEKNMSAESAEFAELAGFADEYGIPKVIIWDGDIYAAAPTVRKANEIRSMLDFASEIYLHAPHRRKDVLSDSEADFLLNWDSEKYRSNLK